jgi:heat shock protein HslJ
MSRSVCASFALWLAVAGSAIPFASSAVANDRPLVCFGNEPSWSVELLEPGLARFATLDTSPVEYRGSATRAEHLGETLWRGSNDEAGGDLVVWLKDAACSDGMSDTEHPVTARVSLPDGRFLAGCCRVPASDAAGTAASSPEGRMSPEGQTWLLTGLPGIDATRLRGLERPATVRFADGRVNGFSGCNTFSGDYTLDGDRLVLGQLASTMMACDEPAAGIEQGFQGAFAGPLQFAFAGKDLKLTNASGVSLQFVVQAPPQLEGVAWTVKSYNNGRQAVVGVTEDATIVMQFEDGEVSGHAGCNRFQASYTVTGDRIEFGPASTTRMACGEALMTQERDFLAALVSSVTWTVESGVLDMHRADGERTVWAVHP